MASLQSSRDLWRGGDCQPRAPRCARPRHRSESRRLSDCRRPMKTVALKRDHRSGALHEGDLVHVFSRHADKWLDGEVVEILEGGYVRVAYVIGADWFGKKLHLLSEHIAIPAGIIASSDAPLTASVPIEHDPEAVFQCGRRLRKPAQNGKNAPRETRAPDRATQPLMQACRSALPCSAEEYYIKFDFILKMLRGREVLVVKGSWLLECYKQRMVLPRRQELPSEAIWGTNEIEKFCREWKIYGEALAELNRIISISHCWYSREHPDPDGMQVQDVGPTLEAYLDRARYLADSFMDYDQPIFWCWCSFFQQPRSPVEEQYFKRSMEHMDLWYTNSYADVWMLTKVPEGALNNMPYGKRGWTTWERTVAGLIAQKYKGFERAPLDLGALAQYERRPLDLDEIKSKCSSKDHRVPLLPDAFAKLMSDKTFTKGPTDRDLVVGNYRRNFVQVMAVVTDFSFRNPKTFDAQQMKQLCLVLPFTTQLKSLLIEDCPIGDMGAEALASVLPKLTPGLHLALFRCRIGDIGAQKLAAAIENSSIECLFTRGFDSNSEAYLSQACDRVQAFYVSD